MSVFVLRIPSDAEFIRVLCHNARIQRVKGIVPEGIIHGGSQQFSVATPVPPICRLDKGRMQASGRRAEGGLCLCAIVRLLSLFALICTLLLTV